MRKVLGPTAKHIEASLPALASEHNFTALPSLGSAADTRQPDDSVLIEKVLNNESVLKLPKSLFKVARNAEFFR